MQQHRFDHITPVLKPLHWLPVEHIITFKIFLLVHKTLSWWVWSIGADLVAGHIIRYNCAEGAFSHCGPVLWKCGTVPAATVTNKMLGCFPFLGPHSLLFWGFFHGQTFLTSNLVVLPITLNNLLWLLFIKPKWLLLFFLTDKFRNCNKKVSRCAGGEINGAEQPKHKCCRLSWLNGFYQHQITASTSPWSTNLQ